MKKDKKDETLSAEAQTGENIKKNMPIKTEATDSVKNSASQTLGLNQANTTRDDLLPSDGDNLTI